MEVRLRAGDGLVTKPEGDHRQIDAALEQVHGRGVPEYVGGDLLSSQGEAALARRRAVLRDEALDRVSAQALSTSPGKQRLFGLRAPLSEPGCEDRDNLLSQWGGALLPALAGTANMSATAKDDVAACQARELRDAKAGLNGHEQQRAIAATDPGGRVGCRGQGLGFLSGEELDEPAFVSFRGDREYALTEKGVGWLLQGYVTEEGVGRRQAAVASPRAVPSTDLEMFEELAHEGSVEILDGQVGRRLLEAFRGEAKQDPERVTIGSNGVSAGASLTKHALDEERLEEGREGCSGHFVTSLA